MGSAIETLVNREYPYGFVTDVETDTIGRGLNEDVIRVISQKKNEPEFMLEWRLKAYRGWLRMSEPHNWPNITYTPVDLTTPNVPSSGTSSTFATASNPESSNPTAPKNWFVVRSKFPNPQSVSST